MSIVSTSRDYGYGEFMENLCKLKTLYPFLHMETIGTSVMGKPIPAIRIGAGPKIIHYNGAFHANEWITSALLMKFAEDYASAYCKDELLSGSKATELFTECTLWLVPMVNPDGVELVLKGLTSQHPYYEELLEWNDGSHCFTAWKANIRGIDLNDQFPAHWEVEKERRSPTCPGPRDYAGCAPLTEPEARVMAEFTESHSFAMVIAFHTQGEEIYWNYRDCEPDGAEELAERLARASGYRAVKLTNSDAGYKDWFIQKYRRTGFTVEAGLGTNPLPMSQFDEIYASAARIMVEGLKF